MGQRIRLVGAILIGSFLGACASSGPKDLASALSSKPKQKDRVLNDVKFQFYKEGDKQCGPASLAMMIHSYRADVSLAELQKMTYSPHADGAFKQDLISATRRVGLTAYPVADLEQMFELSANGSPVLVFQNLGLSWSPQWHYAVLVGYDKDRNKVFVHSGEEANKELRYKRFKNTWIRGGRWSYIISPPDEIPAVASFEQALENAVVLEGLHKKEEALKLYLEMARLWPDRYEANVGLASIYGEQDSKQAIYYLKKALESEKDSPGIYYNLAYLYQIENKISLAKEMRKRVLEVASENEIAFYKQKLQDLEEQEDGYEEQRKM